MSLIPDEYWALDCFHKVLLREGEQASDVFEGDPRQALIFGNPWPVRRSAQSIVVSAGFEPIGKGEGRVTHIVCPILPSGRFVKMVYGYALRAATVEDLFAQYPGPYDLIACLDSGHDREIWFTDEVQSHLPGWYIVAEDGHNEEVIKTADRRGYAMTLCDDALIMEHE